MSQEAGRVALQAWQALGCQDAGRVDVRIDANSTPCFLEVNPLAGLVPDWSDLVILGNLVGIPYNQLMAKIMQSACERLNLTHTLFNNIASKG